VLEVCLRGDLAAEDYRTDTKDEFERAKLYFIIMLGLMGWIIYALTVGIIRIGWYHMSGYVDG
jgi:hypothetical protein